MNQNEFENIFQKYLESINIVLSGTQKEQFYNYMNLLIEWNKKINLTAIIEPEEIILKHFIDSLTVNKFIENESNIIDIGTGAGFPGIPLKIIKPEIEIELIDSLNKRINFLNEVISNLSLKNIKAIHARVEEFAKNKKNRERYDIVTSRAVANLNVLVEYMLPLVKLRGKCICMKGPNIQEEIEKSKNAIKILGGEIESIEEFTLPQSDIKRTIIIIRKIKDTPIKYPRKPGIPSKDPII